MNPQGVKKVKELLDDSIDYRNYLYSEEDWQKYEDYTMAKYDKMMDKEIILPIPVLVSNMQRQQADLFGGDPRVNVIASRPEEVPAARVMTEKLNHLVYVTKLMDQLEDCSQDTMTCGTGLMLDGYGSEFGVHAETAFDGIDKSRYNDKGDRIEYRDTVFEDLPFSFRVHPSDIFLPPGTVRLDEATGFFHRYYRHIDDVRDDEKLIKKHRHAIKPDGIVEYGKNRADEANSRHYQTSENYVILYDYYDFKRMKRTTFNPNYTYALADSVDDIMIRLDRLPLHSLIYNSNSRYFWGTSDFHILEPLQQEINDIRTNDLVLRHMRLVKGIYDRTMLENPDELQDDDSKLLDLVNDKVWGLFGIDPGSGKAVKDFLHFISPQHQYDNTQPLNTCKEEIKEFGTMGGGKNQKGMMEGGRHTAYEAQTANAHYEKGLMPRRKRLRNTIVSIVENWAKLIFEFTTEPQLIQTYDAAGMPVTVEFRGDDLRGNFKYHVSLDSMRPQGWEDKINEANMLMDRMMPFMQPGSAGVIDPNTGQPAPQSVINPSAFVRQYLTKVLPGDYNVESFLNQGAQQAGPPVPFDQYRQRFMQQVPQNQPGIAQLMALQGA